MPTGEPTPDRRRAARRADGSEVSARARSAWEESGFEIEWSMALIAESRRLVAAARRERTGRRAT